MHWLNYFNLLLSSASNVRPVGRILLPVITLNAIKDSIARNSNLISSQNNTCCNSTGSKNNNTIGSHSNNKTCSSSTCSINIGSCSNNNIICHLLKLSFVLSRKSLFPKMITRLAAAASVASTLAVAATITSFATY